MAEDDEDKLFCKLDEPIVYGEYRVELGSTSLEKVYMKITHVPTGLCEEGVGNFHFKLRQELVEKIEKRIEEMEKGAQTVIQPDTLAEETTLEQIRTQENAPVSLEDNRKAACMGYIVAGRVSKKILTMPISVVREIFEAGYDAAVRDLSRMENPMYYRETIRVDGSTERTPMANAPEFENDEPKEKKIALPSQTNYAVPGTSFEYHERVEDGEDVIYRYKEVGMKEVPEFKSKKVKVPMESTTLETKEPQKDASSAKDYPIGKDLQADDKQDVKPQDLHNPEGRNS